MLKALLFDLDGTLTHTDQLHLLAFEQLLLEEGRVLTETEFDAHISGRANPDLCRYLFPSQSAVQHQAFAERKEVLFRHLSPNLSPVAGLLRLLEHADKAQIGMVVVTNAPRANAEHMLASLGLTGRFQSIVVAEELPRAKPDPLPYLTGLERLQASAGQALAFEDSIPGVTAAKDAGIFTVGIATSQSHETLLAAGAQLVVDDFDDPRLWGIIDRASSGQQTINL